MNPQVAEFLEIVRESRSPKTFRTYRSVLGLFAEIVHDAPLTVETYVLFLRETKEMNPDSQAVYRAALGGLYTHIAAGHPEINLAAIKDADKRYVKRRGPRLPTYDQAAVERVIEKANTMRSNLEELRNRAFILVLADSGLRIGEACSLLRGDVDFEKKKAVVIGKGDKQAVVHFKDRTIRAMRDYLGARSQMDGSFGKPLESLPLFARHDPGAGKKVKPVQPGGMWLAIKTIAREVDAGHITPHFFRHYFISVFYERSRDIKQTQVMARHSSISMTEKYTHLSGDTDDIYNRVMED